MDARDFLPNEQALAAIRQAIAGYEAKRRSAQMQVMWRVPLYLALLAVVTIALAIGFNRFADPREQWSSTPHVFLYVVAVVLALVAYARGRKPVADLQRSFRSELLPAVFGFIDNLRYGKGVTPASFDRLPREVVGSFDRQSFDDSVAGSYRGFDFELYEATLKERTAGAELTRFHGVVMAFAAQAPFPGLLVATRREDQVMSFFGGLFGQSLETIRSGVAELDEKYEFRTDNATAAEPLVRGRLAQALQWLGEMWPGEPARVALNGGDGYLLLPTPKNFFELPPVSVPLDYKAHIEPIITDMASLLATAALVRQVGGDGASPE